MNKPTFTMLVGIPGSGKSHWAETHRDELNAVIHSSDAIREELGDINDQSKNDEVFDILHWRVKSDLIAGDNVIYDATNLKRKNRVHMLQHELKDIPCNKICVLFCTPYEFCVANNFARERKVPVHVLVRMYKNFEVPCLQEGWDDIQLVWWNYRYIPGFEYDFVKDLMDWKWISHDNPNHTYSIGDHMISAFCNMSKYMKEYNMDDKRLLIAAAMHDCGKPETKAFINSKEEPCETAHFYQHHTIGSYLSLFYLREMGFSDEDILYTSLLINLHMQPFLSYDKSEKSREKDRRLFGDETLKYVDILHLCDINAH